ncbi:hypothetical protein BD779DRAFT_1478655 [Infundibulicybe gibba]|nr:hypothetical protein BD779DRAFT_1478655 [Infundibulicybe gibba]
MCWARVRERDERDVADSEGWEVVKPDGSGRGVSAGGCGVVNGRGQWVVRDRVDGDGRDMANGGGCEVKGGGQGVDGDGCDVANGGGEVRRHHGGGWGVNGDGRDMASVEAGGPDGGGAMLTVLDPWGKKR